MTTQQISTQQQISSQKPEVLEHIYKSPENIPENLSVDPGLHLASLQALKGKTGFDQGFAYLDEAFELNPNIVHNPLYQALYWEFSAYEGRTSQEVVKGALAVAITQKGLSRYHAARALFATGSLEAVLEVFSNIEAADLVEELKSRYQLLLGQTYQALGQFEEAANVFEQAVNFSQGLERQQILLELASCWFVGDQLELSLSALANIDVQSLNKSQQARFYLLRGKAALKQGLVINALGDLLAAQDLKDYVEDDLEVYLSLAQSLILIGKPEQAFSYFEKVLENAGELKSFVQHEYIFALMANRNYLEAKVLLEELLTDSNYDMHCQALIDLGEVNYQLGFLTEAEKYAQEALEQGEGLQSCFLLGQIASTYYQYDKALTYFEKALSETNYGDQNWLLVHTMIVDILAKQGFKDPRRIVLLAKSALKHMPSHEMWQAILQGYLNRAMEMMGGNLRVLN